MSEQQQKPEQQQPAASYRECPRCHHRNRIGVLICESCGMNLATEGTVIVGQTRKLNEEDSKQLEALKAAQPSLGSGVFESSYTLILHIPGNNQPISIKPADHNEVVFGRQDPSANIFPQVDLTLYAAFQLGLSRKHATVIYKERQLYLQDLKSANGTYLNGVKLPAYEQHQIRNGDEIRMGQLIMQVTFKPA